MYYIGVISENKNLQIKQNHIRMIYLTEENIRNYQNQKWDILVMEENNLENEILINILKNTNYLLIEDNINLQIKLENNINIITFGFKNKSTVTVSSVQEDETIICIQRNIDTIHHQTIEPMEISVKNDKENNINNSIITKIIDEILEKQVKRNKI